MVEHKLKKIGELLDHVANQNHEKLKHFDSELDKKHRLLDKKHDNLLKKHQHLDKRDTVIKQKHTHLKLKEKEYKKILGMKKGLDSCDIVMMLRLQNERMQGSFLPSAREYYEFFGLTPDKLKLAKKNALIMHPKNLKHGPTATL